MNLRDLEYLVSLADHSHFGKAAEACFVSQPALSMQIKKLENFLGVQLLERSNKLVVLTQIGTELAERARNILQQAKEIRDAAKLARDPYQSELRVGIFPTLAPYLLPKIVPVLTEHFPKLTLFLLEEKTDSLLHKLKQGKIDTAILALPVEQAQLSSVVLFDEEFLLAVPPHHALASQKKIRQDHLAKEQLLLLEDGHCLRDQALTLCHSINAKESQRFRATSLETLRHMVAAGVGMTLIPKLAKRTDDGVKYLSFTAPKPSRTVGMVWRSSSAKSLLLKDIANTLRNWFTDDTFLD